MDSAYQPKTDPEVLKFLLRVGATGEIPTDLRPYVDLIVDLPAANGFRKIVRMGDMTPEDFHTVAREIAAGMYRRCA